MPRSWKIPGLMGRGLRAAAYLAASVAGVLLATAGGAKAAQQNQYDLLTTIPVAATANPPCTTASPSLAKFDISFTDARDSLYLLADRTNCSLDVFDAGGNSLLFQVAGFVGQQSSNDVSGPDGVLTVNNRYAFVGDGDSTVKIVDLLTHAFVPGSPTSTGGTARADEMAYDPRDNLVIVANDADTPPFVSFISTIPDNSGKFNVVGKITFTDATGGLEQPVWSRRTGLFYISVPNVNGGPTGEIAIINPKSRTIVGAFPVNCAPAGLALGRNLEALVGCSDASTSKGVQIVSLKTGNRLANFSNVNGADEVWFNRSTDQYFVGAGGNVNGSAAAKPELGIIDANTRTLTQIITTTVGDHSVAVDPVRNHVFLPDTSAPASGPAGCGCIQVYHLIGEAVAAK